MTPLHLVWFKRDLRVTDHAPLFRACQAGPVLAVYCLEPSQLVLPEVSGRHLAFIGDSLRRLRTDLAHIGLPLTLWQGEMTALLEAVRAQSPISHLWSHEEIGALDSFARDRAVQGWCRAHGVIWTELPQTGVIRRLRNRDDWARRWETFMATPCLPAPPAAPAAATVTLPRFVAPPLPPDPCPQRQRGGRDQGEAVLRSFLSDRCPGYRGGLSSPLTAPTACSRLSPHLAWGTLSVREVVQATRARMADIAATPAAHHPINALPSLHAFAGRLHWHCHFMQKLESQPDLDRTPMHPVYEGLRPASPDPARFSAWAAGETGWPLVDACMAQLRATGWTNFRMRAMLVSVSSYLLWQPWQQAARHLARLFTDYEPGIHYPQVQMQAGVTGINALRMYDPVRQARQFDPQGRFVRQWLPALRRVPDVWLFQPWAMPDDLQRRVGVIVGRDIPAPMVDVGTALRQARARFRDWHHSHPNWRTEAQAILQRHGSRNRPPRRDGPAPRRPSHPPQLDLFGP